VEPTLLPSEPLAIAVRYDKNHRDALVRVIDDPDVPIDNSPTEREFQNVAKLRLNMPFAGSTEGALRACVLLGIAATYRALGVPYRPTAPGPSSALARIEISTASPSSR
jgi:hypothetical protein